MPRYEKRLMLVGFMVIGQILAAHWDGYPWPEQGVGSLALAILLSLHNVTNILSTPCIKSLVLYSNAGRHQGKHVSALSCQF
jgi:hypothetical protein